MEMLTELRRCSGAFSCKQANSTSLSATDSQCLYFPEYLILHIKKKKNPAFSVCTFFCWMILAGLATKNALDVVFVIWSVFSLSHALPVPGSFSSLSFPPEAICPHSLSYSVRKYPGSHPLCQDDLDPVLTPK